MVKLWFFYAEKVVFMDGANMALGRDEVREIDRKAIEEYEIQGLY